MHELVFFTRYGYSGASTRYRVYHYKSYLENAGFKVDVIPFFTDEYLQKLYASQSISKGYLIIRYVKRIRDILLLNKNKYVYIEYELLPFFPAWFERLLRFRGIKYVVDYDDAIFHRYDQHHKRFIRKIFSGKIAAVIKNADQVLVGSSYLFEYAAQYNKKITLLPTSIIFQRYNQESTSKIGKPFTIGWIGLASNSINVIDIAPAIQKFAEGKQVKLLLVGFDQTRRSELGTLNVEIRNWSEETEVESIGEFDVGIMPLLDTPFNRGKCGFKLIQYMACGKPTVATPLPANRDINRRNENLLATSLEEWTTGFDTIYNNREYYKNVVGINNKKIIRQHYCVEANHSTFTKLFKSSKVACAELQEA
jgi:glycosyltransferase involved in cell wall biosynthesis